MSVNGAPVPFEINAHANMPHRSAEDVLVFCVARNITARKLYRDELEKSHREKSEALALLDAIFDSAPSALDVGTENYDLFGSIRPWPRSTACPWKRIWAEKSARLCLI